MYMLAYAQRRNLSSVPFSDADPGPAVRGACETVSPNGQSAKLAAGQVPTDHPQSNGCSRSSVHSKGKDDNVALTVSDLYWPKQAYPFHELARNTVTRLCNFGRLNLRSPLRSIHVHA